MSESFTRPFTKAEIAAMRRLGAAEAERDGGGVAATACSAKVLGEAEAGRAGGIPLTEDLLAAYFCTLDPATPNRVRLVLAGAITYFVMPLDIIPDILPVIGFADDAALLMAAIAQVAGAMNEGHRAGRREVELREQGGVAGLTRRPFPLPRAAPGRRAPPACLSSGKTASTRADRPPSATVRQEPGHVGGVGGGLAIDEQAPEHPLHVATL